MINFINIIIVFLLVFMNGFFVAAEFAMVKVRKSKIETMVVEGNKKAKSAMKIINNLNSYLSACQLGITLASLGLGWIGEAAFSKLFLPVFQLIHLPEKFTGSASIFLGFVLITGFEIVLGELVPKSISITNTEAIAIATSKFLLAFYKITYPIIWTFNHSTSLILKLLKIPEENEAGEAHTDEEIKLLVEESYEHGLIDKTELTFVDNIFDFSDKTVKEIMVPRTDMRCIYEENTFDEIVKFSLEEQLTRYPVCKENKDNIVGFVHIKDLYKLKIEGSGNDINKIMRQVKFVPESMSISELLKILQKDKVQMAIIIDEYGGTSGLVTVEDILEEIVGEIQDEFDEEVDEIHKIEEGSYVVDGKVQLEDISELLKIDIEEENIDTIGGWIYSRLDAYPKLNDKINYENYEFTVLECDRKRINKVLIKCDKAEE